MESRRRSTVGSTFQKQGKGDGKMNTGKEIEETKVTEMTKQEAEQVIKTPDFQGFFENSSRLIERALGQEFNLMDEFFAEEDENKDNDRLERGSKLHKKFVFQSDK